MRLHSGSPRRPRRLLAAASLLLAAACSPGGAAHEAGSADGGATPQSPHPLEVEPSFLELGRVPFGSSVSGVYRLRNRSERPLTLVRIGPLGCQCAGGRLELVERSGPERSVSIEDEAVPVTLAPGERAELHFRFDTSRYREPISRKVGGIPIQFRDAPYLLLQWAADVWTPFVVEPWSADLGRVGIRERPEARFLVASHDSSVFHLAEGTRTVDGWELRVSPLANEEGLTMYEVRARAPEELPEGPFVQEFRLTTDLPGAPPVRFGVRGVAVPEVSLVPTRLVFQPGAGRDTAWLEVVSRDEAASPRHATLDLPPEIELAREEDASATRHRFLLRWNGGAVPPGGARGVVRVRTGLAAAPELELPFVALPGPDAR